MINSQWCLKSTEGFSTVQSHPFLLLFESLKAIYLCWTNLVKSHQIKFSLIEEAVDEIIQVSSNNASKNYKCTKISTFKMKMLMVLFIFLTNSEFLENCKREKS